jgi:hypothetical protein
VFSSPARTADRLHNTPGLPQAAVIDVIGEAEHDAFGVHAERGGGEPGIDAESCSPPSTRPSSVISETRHPDTEVP